MRRSMGMAGRSWPFAVLIGTAVAVSAVGHTDDVRAETLSSLAPTVTDIRIGRVGPATRIVLHLNAETDFIHDVAADGRSVFVAFPRIRWTIPMRYERTRCGSAILSYHRWRAGPACASSSIWLTGRNEPPESQSLFSPTTPAWRRRMPWRSRRERRKRSLWPLSGGPR